MNTYLKEWFESKPTFRWTLDNPRMKQRGLCSFCQQTFQIKVDEKGNLLDFTYICPDCSEQRFLLADGVRKGKDRHYLYILLLNLGDPTMTLVYIGKTMNPAKRFPQHVHNNLIPFDLMVVVDSGSEQYIDDLEKVAILKYKPIYNKAKYRPHDPNSLLIRHFDNIEDWAYGIIYEDDNGESQWKRVAV